MKIKIWTLHTRLRWGDDSTEVHLTWRSALESAADLLNDSDIVEDEEPTVGGLIKSGDLDEAEERLADLLGDSGHEWTISEHIIDTEKAEVVP